MVRKRAWNQEWYILIVYRDAKILAREFDTLVFGTRNGFCGVR